MKFNIGVVFFFSSRRRHTRCSRDWSSDVCSSDLGTEVAKLPADGKRIEASLHVTQGAYWLTDVKAIPRSEERRVGKEGSSSRSPGPRSAQKITSSSSSYQLLC